MAMVVQALSDYRQQAVTIFGEETDYTLGHCGGRDEGSTGINGCVEAE